MPELHRERLTTGKEIYRLVSRIGEESGQKEEEGMSQPLSRGV